MWKAQKVNPASPLLLIHERIGADGHSVPTTLEVTGDALRVSVGGRVQGDLPLAAIDQVMARYGKPLADGVIPDERALDLGDGGALRMLRHRAHYDVIARDFVVLVRPGAEPLAELATNIASVLAHLARAASSAK